MEVNIQSKIDNQSQIQSISFSIFLATLIVFFLFYWFPDITKMNYDVIKIFKFFQF